MLFSISVVVTTILIVICLLIHSAYSYVVKAHGKELIKTDIQIKVPQGTYGRVAPRSGLAWKNFIDVGGVYYNRE